MVEPLRLMRAASAGIECPQVSDSPSQLRHPKALANSRSKHDNASASWSEVELEELVKKQRWTATARQSKPQVFS